jgi:hypothetical protein
VDLFGQQNKEMHTEEEIAEAEMARLQRVISSPRSGTAQAKKVVLPVKKDEPAPINSTVSPRTDGKIPAWKQQQLDKERLEQERLAEEKRKKEQASAEIVRRQLEQGIDADVGTTVRDSDVDSGVKVTQVEKLEVRLACELILIE